MRDPRVAIVDYEMCNLFSVAHACRAVGLEAAITSSAAEVDSADAVILPGVGAFGDAMANLRRLGLDRAVERSIAAKKPFLGICLGFQLLFDGSVEFGEHSGLGIVKGTVRRFPDEWEGHTMKVPLIGWERIAIRKPSAMLEGVADREYMYFVHSYYVAPEDRGIGLTTTTYRGFEYCSAIEEGNVLACQFHPEKSADEGIKIYANWAKTINS